MQIHLQHRSGGTLMKVIAVMAVLMLWVEIASGELPLSADVAGGYRVVHGWPILPDGFLFGQVSGVGIDSHNHPFVFHRADIQWVDTLNKRPITPAAYQS